MKIEIIMVFNFYYNFEMHKWRADNSMQDFLTRQTSTIEYFQKKTLLYILMATLES